MGKQLHGNRLPVVMYCCYGNHWSEVFMAVQVFLPARILVVQLWTFHFCSSQVLYLHIDIMTSQVLHTCCIKHTSQNWKLFKLHKTENCSNFTLKIEIQMNVLSVNFHSSVQIETPFSLLNLQQAVVSFC